MLLKTISLQQNLNLLNTFISKNSKSFSDFQKLNLGGSQKILTFGEYSNKKNKSKINKRKVIYYFYNRFSNNKNIKN
jgi:hypothetical protein